MRQKLAHWWFLIVVVFAAVLTFFQIPVASSQGVTLLAGYIPDDLPVGDPNSALWQKAAALNVPLSAQTAVKPMWPTATVKAVTVRALHNGKQIAFLVEWADSSRNDSMVRPQDFRDAVAIQFALERSQPYFCMGQVGTGGGVNIWHWKADWQADITARQDMETVYPNMYSDMYSFADPKVGRSAGPGSYLDVNYLPALAAGNLFAAAKRETPVENLTATGSGTLKSQSSLRQYVQGSGAWGDGKWRVIFSRIKTVAEDSDIPLQTGRIYSLALAAWDGANGERNGMKSTSQWVSFALKESPEELAGLAPVTAAGGVVVPAPTAPVARTSSTAAAPASYDFTGFLLTTAPVLGVAGSCIGVAVVVALFSLTRKRG